MLSIILERRSSFGGDVGMNYRFVDEFTLLGECPSSQALSAECDDQTTPNELIVSTSNKNNKTCHHEFGRESITTAR